MRIELFKLLFDVFMRVEHAHHLIDLMNLQQINHFLLYIFFYRNIGRNESVNIQKILPINMRTIADSVVHRLQLLTETLLFFRQFRLFLIGYFQFLNHFFELFAPRCNDETLYQAHNQRNKEKNSHHNQDGDLLLTLFLQTLVDGALNFYYLQCPLHIVIANGVVGTHLHVGIGAMEIAFDERSLQ